MIQKLLFNVRGIQLTQALTKNKTFVSACREHPVSGVQLRQKRTRLWSRRGPEFERFSFRQIGEQILNPALYPGSVSPLDRRTVGLFHLRGWEGVRCAPRENSA